VSDPRHQALEPAVDDGLAATTPPLTLVEMAAHLAGAMRDAGTELFYGVPGGGANLDVVGAAEATGCRFVLAHGETAATIMAAVTGELTGRPSASVVTRGPGAASAVNGAAQALLDRQPLLLITDCVTTADQSRISHQRLDQQAMLVPATKASVQLGPRHTRSRSVEAVALTTRGRPGPVHIDVDPCAPPAPIRTNHVSAATPDAAAIGASALGVARRSLQDARHPVVIAGVGAVASPAHRRGATVAALRRFVAEGNVPTLTTYKGRGLVPDSSNTAAGVATGATIEAELLEAADLIVGVGLDPVEMIPGPWCYDAPVVLLGGWPVDDSTYFGDRLVAEVVGDLGEILDELTADLRTGWEAGAGAMQGRAARQRVLDAVPVEPVGLAPQQVVTEARSAFPKGAIATVDAGAHMLVSVPLWTVDEPGELLVSSGLATMGFALPAAAAAALVNPDRHVVCFTGDGGLGMVLAELETLARLRLRVIVVVFNDATLSLIAIKQRPEGHGGEGAIRYTPTDFAAIGAACGVASHRVSDVAEYRRALGDALAAAGPTLIDVMVDPSAYPAVIDAIRGSRPAAVPE
jgi:acetolactate synthase I/II/III large subunit